MSLHKLDLNLLKVLDALLSKRSVTRAGVVIGRSQPAVSNALQRLRALLKDDLLVRGGDGYVLTARAEALRAPLREALATIRTSLFDTTPFDPATETGVFRISTPDRLSLAVVPPLFGHLRALAPTADLHVASADRGQALQLLDADEVDVALGWIDETPAHMQRLTLHEEHLYCVFRPGHPLDRPRAKLTLDTVLAYPHLVVSATGGRTAIFDELLARKGLSRHARVAMSNFTCVPDLLMGSDMIGVFAGLAAAAFERSFGLRRRRAPIDIGRIATHLVWHARYQTDRRHMWLREQVVAVYKSLPAARAGR